MLVGFIVLLIVLRFFSLKLVLSDNDSNTKEAKMKKTSTARIMVSSVLETVWAIGVGGIVGQLST